MAKSKTVYRCSDCGADYSKWQGRCDTCGEWNTLVEEAAAVGRTGIATGTLRMWEQRHGFPVPERSPSGHRRYRESEVRELLTGMLPEQRRSDEGD